MGDSKGERSKLGVWLDRLESLKHGTPFTIILEDPLANSFIYSPYGESTTDPLMTSVMYERTFEENEDLGLNDMDVQEASGGTIQSDKSTMREGGRALGEQGYHPNPLAVQESDRTSK
jgi:zinc finger protein